MTSQMSSQVQGSRDKDLLILRSRQRPVNVILMVVNSGQTRTKVNKEGESDSPVSSQVAESLRLAPTPASSD